MSGRATSGADAAEVEDGAAANAVADARPPEYRYGVVFLLVLVLLVFAIIAPPAPWSRAVALALESAALVVAVATSRARRVVRRRRAWTAGICAFAAIAGVAGGVVPASVTPALSGLLAFAVPPALVGGLLRLVRERGVTLHAVAGTLAIYLLVGLLCAWVISLVAAVDSTPYFAQGTSGTDGQRVYFSFTVLTTTGFGDLTPARPVGRALAVLEMLVGQLYLVTVIGLVVTNFRGRGRRPPAG
jgi:ion channel